MYGRHRRTALLVDKFRRDSVWKVCQKDGKTASIGPLFPDRSSAAHNKVIDFFRLDSCPLDKFWEQFSQQLICSQLAKHVSGGIVGS
jgi:hypothetical protein